MAEWRLTFRVGGARAPSVHARGVYLGGGPVDGRAVLRRVAQLDPPPIEAKYDAIAAGEVTVVFVVDAERQFEAVRRQNEIDEKLRTVLKDLAVRIGFDNPAPAEKPKQGS
jgi:hypothetical protein